MKNTGELILKYHGDNYACQEAKFLIQVDFTQELEFNFDFSFPESPTRENVIFNSGGNINSEAVMQPYGIEFIIPNEHSFFVQFMMVESLPDDQDPEMFTGAAKFDIPFEGDANKHSVYRFG